jgi:hypothetical protein
MLMFVAPLALLAGHALAQLSRRWLWAVGAFVFLPSALLAGMQQNSIRVFTANSKAALDFSRAHADADVFVNTNALRAATFNNLVHPQAPIGNMSFIGELMNGTAGAGPARAQRSRFAILDTETVSWAVGEPITDLAAVPSCWTRVGVLQPTGFGWGTHALEALRPVLALVPGRLGDTLSRKLDGLLRPGPAYIFEVPGTGCGPSMAFTVASPSRDG